MGYLRNNTDLKGPNGLTPRQEAFCEEYALCYNATESYLKAFETNNRATASNSGSRLLRDPNIKKYIAKIQKRNWEAKCVNYERIAEELSKIAFGSSNEKNKLQALNLLQKQLGIDITTIKADVKETLDIKVSVEDDAD